MVRICKCVETYRADTETEAEELVESAKNSDDYELIDRSIKYRKKETKKEGLIDEWYRVILTKEYCSEVNPYED